MKNKKHSVEIVHHFIVGFFLTVKGIDKLQHHHFIGGLILAFGIILLLYFLYDILAKRHSNTLKLLVHIFEGLALLLTTYIFFEDGKTYLPYVTFIASIGFFISSLVIFIKMRKKNNKKTTDLTNETQTTTSTTP